MVRVPSTAVRTEALRDGREHVNPFPVRKTIEQGHERGMKLHARQLAEQRRDQLSSIATLAFCAHPVFVCPHPASLAMSPPRAILSDPSTRHMLRFAPVQTIADPDRRDALDSANGVDLVMRRWARILGALGSVGLVAVVVRCLVGW